MLLTASNTLFKLGMRPRAVTTPVRVRSQSGTWDETRTHENLCPNPRPTPTQAANRATKKAHYFSTVHVPRLRESRRANTEVTAVAKAPSSIQSKTWRVARKSASRPLVQGLAQAPSAGIKSEKLERPADAGADQRAGTPTPEVGRPQKSAGGIEERPTTRTRPESPLAHARGTAARAGHNVPPAHVETCAKSYRLSIALPRPGGAQLSSEMITVSVRRGGRLAVVADAWHLEHDCHYEWYAAFPQSDIDSGSIRARVGKDGVLVIDVPRRRR